MKKRISLLFTLLAFCVTLSLGAINEILVEAQGMLKNATTEAQLNAALNKFNSARHDINYNPDEHDGLIAKGIEDCRTRLAQMRKKLIVNGQNKAVESSVPADGGTVVYNITSNVGAPEVGNLPDWISVSSNTGSSITVACQPNTSNVARQAPFVITAGGHTVRVNMHQAGAERKVRANTVGQQRGRQLEITDVSFMNATYDNRVITPVGQPLYAHEMRFLRPVITYDGPSVDKEVDLYTRIYDPDGNMMVSKDISPDGYTQGYNFAFYPGDNVQVRGMGWGNRSRNLFSPGQYRFELWIEGENVYTAYATIIEREEDETYLLVNGESPSKVELKSAGGATTFFVSSSDEDWNIVDLPSFLTVTKKSGNTFTVSYGGNVSPESRRADFYVTGAGRQVRVSVEQPTGGPSATINNVHLTEAVYDGEAGLEIHADIVIRNASGQRVQVGAWFYYETGNPLMDTDRQFRAADGQVTVNRNYDVNTDILELTDLKLFIPYDQLDITDPGDTALEFELCVYDFAVRDFLAWAPRVKFTYHR